MNDQLDEYSGGETWFPKARNGKGINIHPGKGNAVLFYDLLADGNGDDYTLHYKMAQNGFVILKNIYKKDIFGNGIQQVMIVYHKQLN